MSAALRLRARARRVRPCWDWRKAEDFASLRARSWRARRLMVARGAWLGMVAALVGGRGGEGKTGREGEGFGGGGGGGVVGGGFAGEAGDYVGADGGVGEAFVD